MVYRRFSKMWRKLRRIFGPKFIVVVVVVVVFHFSFSPPLPLYSTYSSSSSSSSSPCKIVRTDPYAPEVKRHFRPHRIVDCGADDWVYVDGGRLWFRAAPTRRDLRCRLKEIRWRNDFKVDLGKDVIDFGNGTRMLSDSVFVRCQDEKGRKFKSIFASISPNPDKLSLLRQRLSSPSSLLLPRPHGPSSRSGSDQPVGVASASPIPSSPSLPPNIIILGHDSLSSAAWQRYLPKTVDFFLRRLKGVRLDGYNIVGDGTPQALLPMLTGLTEYELPEARRGHYGAKTVDEHPWIWRNFSARGYMTSFVEDSPAIGAFQYRMLGFKNQPTDVYGRKHYLARENRPDLVQCKVSFCDAGLHRYKSAILNLAKEHFRVSPEIPKFAFLFQGEFSHNDNNLASTMDNDLYDFLEDSFEAGHLNNTILILMSDHGARFAHHRDSEIGKIEERKPFFGFRFPPWFIEQHPNKLANFVLNAGSSLVTPFDIHATLLHLLDLREDKLEEPHPQEGRPNRAFSLFQPIINRTCFQADVEPHWCACLQWSPLSTSHSIASTLAKRAVEHLNSLTEGVRGKCVEWTKPRVKFVAESETPVEMRRFLKTKDADGFVPDLSDNTKRVIVVYQIRLLVSPAGGDAAAGTGADAAAGTGGDAAAGTGGDAAAEAGGDAAAEAGGDAIFELSFESHKGNINVADRSTSRLDAYGNQSACVAAELPHLRQFCSCKSL